MNRNVITATRTGRLIDSMARESLHAKRVHRNEYEDTVLLRLHDVLPPGIWRTGGLATRAWDRMLTANTAKTRTHSLFRQLSHYYASIPAIKQELLDPLAQRFGEYVLGQPGYVHAFGLKCGNGLGNCLH